MAVVFLSFIIIGIALPVLPLHVHDVLGFGPLIVGVVAGGQFAAALISRLWAGRLSDSRGAKYAVALGLIASVIRGVFYIASLFVLEMRVLSVSLILIGRTLLGGAESLIITGGIAWGLGLVSNESSAKVICLGGNGDVCGNGLAWRSGGAWFDFHRQCGRVTARSSDRSSSSA